MVGQQLHEIAAEAGEVGRHGRHTESDGLERCVTPRLVVAREDAEVAAAHEVVVLHAEQRAGGADEVGVVDDFDRIVFVVPKSRGAQLIKYVVLHVVDEVVGDDGRRQAASPGVHGAAKAQPPVVVGERVKVRDASLGSGDVESVTDLLLDAVSDRTDFLQHRLIQISTHQINWNQVLQAVGIDAVPTRQLCFTDSTQLSLNLAAAGYGIALARAPTTNPLVDRLGLKPCGLCPELKSTEAYYLSYRNRESLSAAAGSFRNWLLEQVAALDSPA